MVIFTMYDFPLAGRPTMAMTNGSSMPTEISRWLLPMSSSREDDLSMGDDAERGLLLLVDFFSELR